MPRIQVIDELDSRPVLTAAGFITPNDAGGSSQGASATASARESMNLGLLEIVHTFLSIPSGVPISCYFRVFDLTVFHVQICCPVWHFMLKSGSAGGGALCHSVPVIHKMFASFSIPTCEYRLPHVVYFSL